MRGMYWKKQIKIGGGWKLKKCNYSFITVSLGPLKATAILLSSYLLPP